MKKIFEKVKENKEIIATAAGVTAVVLGLKAEPKALENKKEEEVLEQYPEDYSAEDLEANKFSVSFSITPAAALVIGGSIYAVKNGIKVYKKYIK